MRGGVLRGGYPYLFEGLVTLIYLFVTCGLIDCDDVIVSERKERKEERSYGRREGL